MPSPFGEGQTDTPINRLNLGEVPKQTPLPSPPRGRSQNLPETELDLETQHAYQRRKEVNSMPSPFGEGQTDMPINHHHLGEVPLPLPSPVWICYGCSKVA